MRARIDAHVGAHPGAERGVRVAVEADEDRDALDDLDVVPRRVVRREEGEARAGRAGERGGRR